MLALVATGAEPAGSAIAAGPGYSAKLGKRHRSPKFGLSYAGSGTWATTYTSQPPNPGGKPDHNSAHDTSRQSWRLSFRQPLTVPRCAGHPDPCVHIRSLLDATGTSAVTGDVNHSHIDGLYSFDNASIRCQLKLDTPRGAQLAAEIEVRFIKARTALAITALDPVQEALGELPMACPKQGDPIDGLLDSYFAPGFSFASDYGPARWFTSARVVIPIATIDRARSIRIPLAQTRAGTPPRKCAVPDPSYEQCATGGSWSGVLTLRYRH